MQQRRATPVTQGGKRQVVAIQGNHVRAVSHGDRTVIEGTSAAADTAISQGSPVLEMFAFSGQQVDPRSVVMWLHQSHELAPLWRV